VALFVSRDLSVRRNTFDRTPLDYGEEGVFAAVRGGYCDSIEEASCIRISSHVHKTRCVNVEGSQVVSVWRFDVLRGSDYKNTRIN